MRARLRNQIIGLAAVAGMRTMMPPALLSSGLRNRSSKRLRRSKLQFMQSGSTATIFKLLAAGELIGDKLPMTPSRTEPAGLVGRGLSGALVGATLAIAQRENYVLGASIGLLSALTSTYTCYYARKKLTEETQLPDIVWAGLEDMLAIRMGRKFTQ